MTVFRFKPMEIPNQKPGALALAGVSNAFKCIA